MASIRMSAKDIENFELEISTEDMLPRECSKCGRYTKGVKLSNVGRVDNANRLHVRVCFSCNTVYLRKYIYYRIKNAGNDTCESQKKNRRKKNTLSTTKMEERKTVLETNDAVNDNINTVVHVNENVDYKLEKKNSSIQDRVTDITDDFGNEFDLSELNHLLNLK